MMRCLFLFFSILCVFISFSIPAVWPPVEGLSEGDIQRFARAIQNFTENEHTTEDIKILKEFADKGHPDCLLHYGEYLLHHQINVKEAIVFINKAAEEGSDGAKRFIESVIGEWTENVDERISSFCKKWPSLFSQNMKTIYPEKISAQALALWFLKKAQTDLSEDNDVTNMKLQKVLYCAQEAFLKSKKEPLFHDPIDAWQYGPVIKTVYDDYKNYSHQVINLPHHDLEKFDIDLQGEDMDILERVWEVCKKYSAGYLSKATHERASAWATIYNGERGQEITIFHMLQDDNSVTREIMADIQSKRARTECNDA